MIEISFEASKAFCAECTQDGVVTLINSALYRLKCYETRSKSVHIVDITLHDVKAGSKALIGNVTTKCALVVSGKGVCRGNFARTIPLVSGLFLIYDEQLIIEADDDLKLYEGSVEFL